MFPWPFSHNPILRHPRTKGNKAELRAIADRHSTDVPYNDFIKIYNKCTSQPYSLVKAIKGLSDEEDEGDRKKIPALMAGMRGFDQAKGTVDGIYDDLKVDQVKYLFEVNKQTTYKDPTKNIVKPSEMIDAMIREPDRSHNIYMKTVSDLQKIYEDNVKGA